MSECSVFNLHFFKLSFENELGGGGGVRKKGRNGWGGGGGVGQGSWGRKNERRKGRKVVKTEREKSVCTSSRIDQHENNEQ